MRVRVSSEPLDSRTHVRTWSCAKTLQTFTRSIKPKPYKLKIFTDVDEFQDLSEMIKEMPSITSKRQLKLIKWVNSIEELIK